MSENKISGSVKLLKKASFVTPDYYKTPIIGNIDCVGLSSFNYATRILKINSDLEKTGIVRIVSNLLKSILGILQFLHTGKHAG